MQRPGTDENNVQMSDILCDFCRREWTMERPMVEGHRGSCICGDCLRLSYSAMVLEKQGNAPAGYLCTLCRENRDEIGWVPPVIPADQPADPPLAACRRCVNQSAAVLAKDKEYGWAKPTKADSGA
jgi:hypothetical protein